MSPGLHRRFAERVRSSRSRRDVPDAPGGITWLPTLYLGEDGDLPDGWAEWMLETVQGGHAQVDEIRASHMAALSIVQRYVSELEPFAMYLRSFDIEAMHAPVRGRRLGKDVSYVEFVNEPSAVERVLIESLDRVVPVITVADPSNRFVAPGLGRLPRLVMRDDDWRSVVGDLVRRAAIIVVELIHLSPGLREELQLLSHTRVQTRAVMALDTEGSEESERLQFQEAQARFASGSATTYEPVRADDLSIRAFPRAMPIDELVAGPLEHASQFADLLLEVGHDRGLTASDRHKRNDALALSDGAAQLALAGFLPEAVVSSLQALEQFAALDDDISVIGASADLAFIASALEDSAKTRESVAWIVRSARRLSSAERAGLLHRFASVRNLPEVLAGLNAPDLEQELATLFDLAAPTEGQLD